MSGRAHPGAPEREPPGAGAILVVSEGEDALRTAREALAPEAYEVACARGCEEAWGAIRGRRPALVIVDSDIEGGRGASLCSSIRKDPAVQLIPVILLVDKGGKEGGFAARADACLEHPVPARELRLWVRALLRRVRRSERAARVLRAGDFTVDRETGAVTAGPSMIGDLTPMELAILCELVRRRPHVVSKGSLMKSVGRGPIRENTIEVHVRNLRRKLGPAAPRVVTVLGAGYRFE